MSLSKMLLKPPSADFMLGALSALGSLLAYKVWKLFQYPSLASIQKTATEPVKKAGSDDNTITVWGFHLREEHPAFYQVGVPDASPYVTRVECYLRLLKKDYSKKKTNMMTENPRRKVPFCNIYGTMMDDSQRILDHLKANYADDSVEYLTDAQKITGHLIQRMLTGNMYWVCLHTAFGTDAGRDNFRAQLVTEHVPFVLRPLISSMVFRLQNGHLKECGMANFPHNEILERGKADLRVLNKMLGKQTTILGTPKPTVYDTDVYSFVCNLFYHPAVSEEEWVQDLKREMPLLEQYVARMRSLLFPELQVASKTE